MKKLYLLCLLCLLPFLPACASFSQGVAASSQIGIKDLQLAEDNNIQLIKVQLCALPFSAIVRNSATVQGLIPAVKGFCLPTGSESQPVTIIDPLPSK